jgi:UDP-glucose 4-epimerase
VHGDGEQSRDFTYIDDVVAANLAAASAAPEVASGNAYNIACGGEHSLLELLEHLSKSIDVVLEVEHVEPRAGDVRHSLADVSAAARDLDWVANVEFCDGLARTVDSARSE